jgi:G6PDH family F420-dependent oxidoreductase
MRYHPAVVVQQAATLALLSGNRFTLGLGAGENLNEHVIGDGWPDADQRQEMLAEAVSIIRDLLNGGYVNFKGTYFRVNAARIWDLLPGALGGTRPRPAARSGYPMPSWCVPANVVTSGPAAMRL